jgi:hypothetical protein
MKQPFNNKKLSSHIKLAKVTISEEVRDYSNDPTIIKRAQEAKEFLEKHPFPFELLEMIDAQNDKK